MSQHDFNISNQSFPNTRSDLNNALVALATNSSGAAAPSTTNAFSYWADSGNDIMKLRNEANSDWISLYKTDGVQQYASGSTAALPAFSKADDVDTGVFFPSADNCSIGAGNSQIINCNSNGLTVNHAFNTKVVSKTSTYTAANESIILVDASSGAVTINLPAALGLSGREYTITKTDSSSNNILIDANASETINGSTVFYLNVQYEQVKLVCTGTSWIIAGANFDVFSCGQIIPWSGTSVPAYALECNGANVNRTTYARLFDKIGTIYGVGDGSTTFGLPDYRGRFLRGFDNTAGTDPDAASRTDRGDGTTGDAVGTKQADELKSHNHSSDHQGSNPTVRPIAMIDHGNTGPSGTANPQIGTGGRGNVFHVNNGGSESRPKNINVMYCIKV